MDSRQKFNLIALLSCLYLVNICFAYQDDIERVPLAVGAKTTMTCDIGERTGLLRWTFNGRTIEPSDKYHFPEDNRTNRQILIIVHTDYSDEGEYTCLDPTTGYGRTFLAKGKPRFKIVSVVGRMDVKSIHVNQGQDIDIKCYIPNKLDIMETERYNFTWYREGKPISQTIFNDRSNTLTILSVQHFDRGTYTCFAFNGVQNHTESIELRVRDTYAYVWPLICILCELVILVLVIYIFDDKDARPEAEESDNDTNAVAPLDRSSHKSPDPFDQEVRQRK